MTHAHEHPAVAPAAPVARPERVVAALAMTLAASLVIQNAVVIGVGAPGYGDPIAQVVAFHAENRTALGLVFGLEALNLPLLLGLVTGLHGLVRRRGAAGADWSRLAMVAASACAAILALYAVLWVGVVLASGPLGSGPLGSGAPASGPLGSGTPGAGTLAVPTPVIELVWRMHAAAFALALPALGTTLLGAAVATHLAGLTQRWQRLIGIAGGGSLIAAGAASLAIADGSPLVLASMPGYAAWIAWLAVTGIRLLRS